jgi:UDP-glucose 4-epimerase
MAEKVVLIAGVASGWGAQVAARLIAESGLNQDIGFHVIGIDTEPPKEEIKGLDFIQADVRNPLLVNLLLSEGVDTVCHLAFIESVRPTEAAFDVNVMGTMKVLGACSEAGVRKVVLKSSTAVYGANPANPAFITEDHPLQSKNSYGYTRHQVEIEAFCNGFRRQVPEMTLTILRFANIIGPKADTPMTRFLKEPLAPVLLGFDPLMQVIHEKDVIEALLFAILNDVPGIFNVAAEGVLSLSRLLGLAAKIPLPVLHWFAYLGAGLVNSAGLASGRYAPIELDYLRYPVVADLAKMRDELGFMPQYTMEEAVREFAGEQRLRRYMPESAALAYDEERLRDTIERRRRARELEVKILADEGDVESHE